MSSSHNKATLDYCLEAMDRIASDLNLRYSVAKQDDGEEIVYGQK